LAIGPENSAIENLIKTTNTGVYATANNANAIKGLLMNFFQQFLKGDLKSYPIGLNQFSRKALTKKLADVL
jgi:hypothetical protein